jgi:hypothetical protein
LRVTCDPAGAAQNSQGLPNTPVGVLSAWYRELGERDEHGRAVAPYVLSDANQPEQRSAANQRAATYMRRVVNGQEAFLVDPERWIVAELGDERQDSFFLDGLEAGYVLEPEPRHSNRLGTFWLPQKDGYYEHAQNCFEYAVLAYVQDLPKSGARAEAEIERHDARRQREQQRELQQQQRDFDPDDQPVGGSRRGGY